MKILVVDVAASYGGALSILEEYYSQAIDDSNDWVFMISTPIMKDTKNIQILNFAWVKKSWIHRIFFDIFIAPKIARRIGPEKIISLQNTIIPFTSISQSIYLHQALLFCTKKYRIYKNFKFWMYQNIVSIYVFLSIKKANNVIVQTEWMKRACIEKIKINGNKVIVEKPSFAGEITSKYKYVDNTNLFFYPASGLDYKNHQVIVDAVSSLNTEVLKHIKVVFTLNGNENRRIIKMKKIVDRNKLPIEFIGYINKNEVYNYYTKSILIFPSLIETFGLPLLEASKHNTPIVASDLPYAREVLEGYDNADFFNPLDANELKEIILGFLKNEIGS